MQNEKIKHRKIVVVNQAVNYLTIGMCNAFAKDFEHVALITGSIHVQGEELADTIQVHKINQWYERPLKKKNVFISKSLLKHLLASSYKI